MITHTLEKIFSKRKYIFIAGLLILILSTYSVVNAVWVTINTDNTVVDIANWNLTAHFNPVYTTPNDCSLGINDDEEIRYGFIANNGSHYFFRIETCAGPAISAEGRRVIAGFDCSDPLDYDADDPEDRLAIWYEFEVSGQILDTVYLYSGNGDEIDQVTNATGTSYDEFGERVGTDDTSIEWQMPIEFIEQNRQGYPGCNVTTRDTPIGLATYNINIVPGIVDSTGVYLWDQPSIVQLREFGVTQSDNIQEYLVLSLGVLLLIGFVVYKISKSNIDL